MLHISVIHTVYLEAGNRLVVKPIFTATVVLLPNATKDSRYSKMKKCMHFRVRTRLFTTLKLVSKENHNIPIIQDVLFGLLSTV